jgi:predicted nucleotidyltransferase
MADPQLHLTPVELQIVLATLKRHVPEREVWAFGSRAGGVAKPYSDLDLAVLGDAPLPVSSLGSLQEDFAESDLPFRVDVVDWSSTSDSFREVIRRHRVVVQEGGADQSTGEDKQETGDIH